MAARYRRRHRCQRESLAVTRKGSSLALKQAAPGRNARNSEVSAEAARRVRIMQRIGEEIWRKYPNLTKNAVAKIVHQRWKPSDGEDPAEGTIRQKIQKPDKA